MNLFSKIKSYFALELLKLIANSLNSEETDTLPTKQKKMHLDTVVYEPSRDAMLRDRYVKL